MKKKILIIVDPQNDFIEGGSLAVGGAKRAMDNLTRHLQTRSGDYDHIYVSLDTHNPTNLGFKENWEGPGVDKIIPCQPFPVEAIKSGEIYPKFKYTRNQDIALILKQPGFMAWPVHCLKSSEGHDIYPKLDCVLAQLKDKVTFMTKGENDARDNYSIFHYGDGELTEHGKYFNLWDKNQDNLEICVAGLALDYCVYETIKSLQEISPNVDYHVLTQMVALIQDRDITSELYKNLKKKVGWRTYSDIQKFEQENSADQPKPEVEG